MSAEGSTETLLQDSQNEKQGVLLLGIGHHLHNLKQFKSFEILKSSLKIFTKNPKFSFLVILSIFPLFVSMVFFEFELQKSILYASSNSLQETLSIPFTTVYLHHSRKLMNINTPEKHKTQDLSYYFGGFEINTRGEFFSNTLQVFLFYFFIYPFLEFLSLVFTIKMAAKLHTADKQATLRAREVLKSPSIAYLCVHLLSTLTLLGLFWVVTNHQTFTGEFYYFYYYSDLEICLNILSIAVHSVIFLGLLYKYLDWSAIWNLGIVISVMEEETGISALGLSEYYGKHSRKTGFQLMLVLFVFGNVPRLFGLCTNGSVTGVLTTFIVVIVFTVVNLVKWVAFLQYYFYSKQQTMEKKVDDHQELGQTTVRGGDMA